jgi:hypothetical protein
MNEDIIIEPFHFSNTFLLLIGYAKVISSAILEIEEGIAKWHVHGKVISIPDYTTISRRTNRLDIKIQDNKSKEFEDNYIVIAIDSTSIKVTNRGKEMIDRWNVRKKRYLKIHIATNVKIKVILSMKVIADEHVHDDSKLLPKLFISL